MTDIGIQTPVPLDVLAKCIREAYERATHSHQEWIDSTLEMAVALRQARGRFKADREFSHWIVDAELEHINPDDRAALINMAENLPLARIILEETQRTSWRLIWLEEMHLRFRSAAKPPENNANSSSTALASNPASPSDDQRKTEPSGRKPELIKLLAIDPKHYGKLASAYPLGRMRMLSAELVKLAKITKLGGKKYFPGKASAQRLFDIALKVAEDGLAVELSNYNGFDARMFLPHVPEAFCKYLTLTTKTSRGGEQPGILALRLDRIAPLNLRAQKLKALNRSVSDTHAELLHYWENGADLPPKVEKPIELAPDDSKQRIKHEVKFCSERIWPKDLLKHVTYEDMNAGWHLVDYWVKHLEHASPQKPKEVAVQLRHLIWDLQKATSITGLIDVMLACMVGYSKRNDSKDRADLSDSVPPGLAR